MKTTDAFKTTIEKELQRMAEADSLFAKSLQNPGKNIDDCLTYILNTVRKSGCNGFADEEIYGMAAHYYDESEIVVGEKIEANVAVNHTVDLSGEDIAEAKRQARAQLIEEERERLRKPKTKTVQQPQQLSLI